METARTFPLLVCLEISHPSSRLGLATCWLKEIPYKMKGA